MDTPFPQLTADTADRPELFFWYGPCRPEELEEWLQTCGFEPPEDLCALWLSHGGGEVFEGEDLAVPFGGPEYALSVKGRTEHHRSRGLPESIVLFHSGVGLSGVLGSSGRYVAVAEGSYVVEAEYESLDDWYRGKLRALYAEVYGLGPEQPRMGRRTMRSS
jgi:hypothetical protein